MIREYIQSKIQHDFKCAIIQLLPTVRCAYSLHQAYWQQFQTFELQVRFVPLPKISGMSWSDHAASIILLFSSTCVLYFGLKDILANWLLMFSAGFDGALFLGPLALQWHVNTQDSIDCFEGWKQDVLCTRGKTEYLHTWHRARRCFYHSSMA